MTIQPSRAVVCLGVLVAALAAACGSAPGADEQTGESSDELVTCPTTGAIPIAEFKELTIVDPSVVNDPVRTLNTGATPGHWSFRWLVEQMVPTGQDPAVFVEKWIQEFGTVTSLNGDPVSPRSTAALLADFPRLASGKLDLTRNPMKLLAIVNRLDLKKTSKPAGEGRFVFGVRRGSGLEPMTVIFEYNQPTTTTVTANTWAQRWHTLGGLGFGAAFNVQLQKVTDAFALRNAAPTAPNGSALSQLRTNEIVMGSVWQLREFTLLPTLPFTTVRKSATGATLPAPAAGFLRQTTVKETPDHTNATQKSAFGAWAATSTNWPGILNGSLSVPSNLLGGNSDENGQALTFTQAVPANVRTKLARNRCDGCHSSEAAAMGGNLAGFYHLAPRADNVSVGNRDRISGFVIKDIAAFRKPIMQKTLCPPPAARAAFRIEDVDAGSAPAAEDDLGEETRVH